MKNLSRKEIIVASQANDAAFGEKISYRDEESE